MTQQREGERFADGDEFPADAFPADAFPADAFPADAFPGEEFPGDHSGPHVWRTLGFRPAGWASGRYTVEWDAPVEFSFPTANGPVVQGGLVTALLDGAMGGACWSLLNRNETFLTADLRVEFLRTTRPGPLSATGTVVRRTRRVVFCAAELVDAAGDLLATSRCTQVVLPA